MYHSVLVVDDDADINESSRRGCASPATTVGALTGAEALAEVERRIPDLVLLDQMLPDIDGVEVCRRLRAAPETRRVPIMFLTACGSEDARVRGLALGADDYVMKPFSMQELMLRVGAVLRRATPVEMHLPPEWIRLREQFRVWNSYAEIHLDARRVARLPRAVAQHPAQLRRAFSVPRSAPGSTSGSPAARRSSATSRGAEDLAEQGRDALAASTDELALFELPPRNEPRGRRALDPRARPRRSFSRAAPGCLSSVPTPVGLHSAVDAGERGVD